jgi:uncharacterized membrane protein YhiD involved in acid resistance
MINFLTGRVSLAIIGVLSALLAIASITSYTRGLELKAAQGTIRSYKAALATQDANVSSLEASLAQQNAAVLKLSKVSKDEQRAYKLRLAEAAKRAAQVERNVGAILSAQTTETDELGRCRAAGRLIQENLQ